MNCSLVCLDWAHRCRPRLIRAKFTTIISLADLTALESLDTGSTRLVPINKLLKHRIHWEQDWESQSWCYKAHNSPVKHWSKHNDFLCRGPVPAHLPRSACRSPHWALPRSMPSCYLPFEDVTLRHIRFPCLSDLGALARHFTSSCLLHLEHITWNSTNTPVFSRPVKTKPRLVAVRAEGCQDNALACIVAYAHLFPSPFPHMGSEELAACIALLRTDGAVPPNTGLASDFTGCWMKRECDIAGYPDVFA